MRPDPPAPPAPRRWGRGLIVLAVAVVCAVPATDALAAAKGRAPAAKPKPAATSRVDIAKQNASIDLGKEALRRGWAWGNAIRGEVVTPGRKGLQTVQFQRGVVSDLTATTVVVTSADGVSITWTLSSATAVIVPRALERRQARATAAVETTETATSTSTSDPTSTTEPTTSTSTSTGGPALTGKLSKGLQVRVWGLGAGDDPGARLVIADPSAPKPKPTTTTTTSTPTTTSTTLPPE